MNIYLLQLIGKWFSLLFMSIASMFGTFDLSKEIINVNNYDKDKSSMIVSSVVEYDTIIKYNEDRPLNSKRTLVNGENGIIYQNKNGTKIKTLKEKVDEVIEIGTGKYGEYTGTLTLYGPDCATCDGIGAVACAVDGKTYNLKTDGVNFNDSEYGEVRILAAPLKEFPCGTVVEINNSDMTKTYGIVLDTGGALVNAYQNGNILFDLAHLTETDLPHGTNKNTKFSVRRWGW